MRRIPVIVARPTPLEDEYGSPSELDEYVRILLEEGSPVPDRFIELTNMWRALNGMPLRDPALVASAAEFHLQGRHDQKSHGNRGGSVLGALHNTFLDSVPSAELNAVRDQLRAGYEAIRLTDAQGASYSIRTKTPSWGLTVDGEIVDADGAVVGKFRREFHPGNDREDIPAQGVYLPAVKLPRPATVLHADLHIEPEMQGRGIGRSFTDASLDLYDTLGVERIELIAAEVGRYAWAAEGYRLDPTRPTGSTGDIMRGSGTRFDTSVRDAWVAAAEEIVPTLSARQQTAASEVLDRWRSDPYNVYGVDLLAVDQDAFKSVFLDGPEWHGYRDLRPGLPPPLSVYEDGLVDPRHPLAATAPQPGVERFDGAEDDVVIPADVLAAAQRRSEGKPEQFHLRGTEHDHDQSTHGRGGVVVVDAPDVGYRALVDGRPTTLAAADAVDVLRRIGADHDGSVVDLTNLTVDHHDIFVNARRDGVRARADMPQVPAAQLDNFHDHLEEAGVTFTDEIVDPLTIKSTQTELDAVKVGQMVDRIIGGTFVDGHHPWISNDGYILDGHHRWAAYAVLEAAERARPDMKVQRVDLPIRTLLALADEFNREHDVQRKTIHMAAILAEHGFHLQGRHDQQSHGNRGGVPAPDIDGLRKAIVDGDPVYTETDDGWGIDPARPFRRRESVRVLDDQAQLIRRSPDGLDGAHSAQVVAAAAHDGTAAGVEQVVRSLFAAPERAEKPKSRRQWLGEIAADTEAFHLKGTEHDHDQSTHGGGGKSLEAAHTPPMDGPLRYDEANRKFAVLTYGPRAVAYELTGDEQASIDVGLSDLTVGDYGKLGLIAGGVSNDVSEFLDTRNRLGGLVEFPRDQIPIDLGFQLQALKYATAAAENGSEIMAGLRPFIEQFRTGEIGAAELSTEIEIQAGLGRYTATIRAFAAGWNWSVVGPVGHPLQAAAAREWDLGDAMNAFRGHRSHTEVGARMADELAMVAEPIVAATYRVTQRALDDLGVGDTVRLHRGLREVDANDYQVGDVVQPFPLSSWTTSESYAAEFSGILRDGPVITVEVPREDVWSLSNATGFGDHDKEVVVVGNWQLIDEVRPGTETEKYRGDY